VIDDAIEAGVPGIWLQQGIFNTEGLERAKAAGLVVTQDRCALVEHKRMTRTQ
jgi:predicted CoA-binding protein